MKRLLVFSVMILGATFLSFAQKHTFTNNRGEYKDFNTGKDVKSNDVDDITIENLGGGIYKLTDSKESIIFKFSHIEAEMYVYRVVKGKTLIYSVQKMSSLAKGNPGKIGIDLANTSVLLTYWLDN
jgi:hypothetical protein